MGHIETKLSEDGTYCNAMGVYIHIEVKESYPSHSHLELSALDK